MIFHHLLTFALTSSVSTSVLSPVKLRKTSSSDGRCRDRSDTLNLASLIAWTTGIKLFEPSLTGTVICLVALSKVGSDLNFILFNILPQLSPGVLVHFHDIFYPFEYPKDCLLEGRAWNECYLLRAFLQHNSCFNIVFFFYWNRMMGLKL